MYIGVDLGTSAVKLLLMDDDGQIVKSISKEYPISFPKDGWSEQNPEDWYTQSVAGIREFSSGCEDRIEGIGVGGQMHGLVVLDENDEVIRPAILWNDGRTGEEVDYLNNVIGKDKLSEYTGNIAFAGFTAPKILWMKKNEPENFGKIKRIMLPKDYIVYRFTGISSSDYSDAAGMLLLDTKNKKWSQEMIDICGISEEMLPKLYENLLISVQHRVLRYILQDSLHRQLVGVDRKHFFRQLDLGLHAGLLPGIVIRKHRFRNNAPKREHGEFGFVFAVFQFRKGEEIL